MPNYLNPEELRRIAVVNLNAMKSFEINDTHIGSPPLKFPRCYISNIRERIQIHFNHIRSRFSTYVGYTGSTLPERYDRLFQCLTEIGRSVRWTSGNSVSFIPNGDATLKLQLDCIDSAKTRVWIETYIMDDSMISKLFRDSLIRAARRGCDVVLVVDACGASGFIGANVETDVPNLNLIERDDRNHIIHPTENQNVVNYLRSEGVNVVVFNPWENIRMSYRDHSTGHLHAQEDKRIALFCFRDHRKLSIIDNTGFCGSTNIHEETCGTSLGGTEDFLDLHVVLKGPSVSDLSRVFCDSLHESGSGVLRDPIHPTELSYEGEERFKPLNTIHDWTSHNCLVAVLDSNVRKGRRNLQCIIKSLIRSSEEKILIGSPYCSPPKDFRRILLSAHSKRGVKLSFVVSGKSDIPLYIDLAAQMKYMRKFVSAGCPVHLYTKKHFHGKYTVVDSLFTIIGSFNYHPFSTRRNLECSVLIFDAKFANKITKFHESMVVDSSRADLTNFFYANMFARFYSSICAMGQKFTGMNIVDGFDRFDEEWSSKKRILRLVIERSLSGIVAFSNMWSL